MVNAKILVVEDENIVARDIQQSLESLGYEVIGITSTGDGALAKAEEEKPDLVLMDILLKGHLNGIEVADRMRNRHGVPVVYLTAYTDDKTLHKAKLTRPVGFIVKPFEDRELKATIEVALHDWEIKRKLQEKILELEQYREVNIEQETKIEKLKKDFKELVQKVNSPQN